MNTINEFTPVELIIIDDINELPDIYHQLLKTWLYEKFGYKGNDIEEAWDWGDEIRIIHWEWLYKNEYYLIIDITGFPENDESGIICFNNNIVFENDCLILSSLDLKSILNSRIKEFEHVRTLNCEDDHQHCKYVSELYNELESDLSEEEVSDNEFTQIVTTPYRHYSSDDASDISSSDDN